MALTFTFIIQNDFLWRLKQKENSNISWPINIKTGLTFSQIREIHDYIHEHESMNNSEQMLDTRQYYSMFYQHIYNPHVDKYSKYKLLENCLNNQFVPQDVKNRFLQFFCRFQKTYFGFSKLALLYKLRRAKKEISYDMCFNELNEKSRNVLTVLIDGHRYLYVLSDIVNIFQSALTNMNYMICTPIAVKNPYTNKDFSISILYTFYFFLKSRLVSVPQVIEGFYKLNFDLHTFTMLYDNYLQDFAINRYVQNTPFTYLLEGMCCMMNDYNIINQDVNIHPLFPEKDLFDIMKKPYLLFYYKSKYSRTYELNKYYGHILRKMLHEFFIYNPKFGTVNFISSQGEYDFNKKHISIKEVYRRISSNNSLFTENIFNDTTIYPSLGRYRNRRSASYTSYNSNMNLDTSSSDDDTIDVNDTTESREI